MISVLMCTYNREHLLKRAIDSILNQTYQDIECIIVDDGSTDNTKQLVESYTDKRIRYIQMERNSYYCYAANYGLSCCEGEYVAFMNSDDVWMPEKLEKQLEFMEDNPKYGACFSAAALIDDRGEDITEECPAMRDLFAKQYDSQKDCLQYLFKYSNSLCHPSALVRKDVLDRVGGFNLLYCQLADHDLWTRIVTEYPIYVSKERLIQFRWDVNAKDQISSATTDKLTRVFNEQILIRKRLMEQLSDEKLKAYFGEWFKNKNSESHIELEFERAFILAECINESPELKVLGIEKLQQVMRMPGAMEVLRNHFKMDIFDLYQWNKEQMYWTGEHKALKEQVEHKEQHIINLEDMMNHQKNLIEQKEQHIVNLENMMNHQKEQIEQKEQHIAKLEHTMNHQKELIDIYENSTSWKVTKPLRDLTRMLKNTKK